MMTSKIVQTGTAKRSDRMVLGEVSVGGSQNNLRSIHIKGSCGVCQSIFPAYLLLVNRSWPHARKLGRTPLIHLVRESHLIL